MNAPWLRRTCKAWPGVTFDVKWGHDFVASVGGKMFAVVEAKKKESGISFKVPADRFLELTDQPGIEPAPYVARYKWVRIPAPKALGGACRRSHPDACRLWSAPTPIIVARFGGPLTAG